MTTSATVVALALALVLCANTVAAQPPCCGGSGGCCAPPAACLLGYGASGRVTDAVTGLPIAGAGVRVVDVDGTTDADGRFDVIGSKPETCNIDYYFSITISASGYAGYRDGLYTNSLFAQRDVMLQPLGQTPTPTATPLVVCAGDCNGDGAVDIDELITALNVVLGQASVGSCGAADRDASGDVDVAELVAAVARALGGCSSVG